ncbi:MAG: SLBB domain-containing protein, partial [Clostridia bacterium]|nr:SLBB domain-containing protein [Clostridia bacterium]
MDKILQSIFQAGVVGCGGAGFPTHAKLNANPEYLLVNGAECEPLLRTDRFLMLHKAKEIVSALAEIKQALRCPKTIIVMKDTYKEEIGSLKAAIREIDTDISFCLMKSFYPAGDEHAVVYEATGRVVPAAGIPLDVGCVVSNAATIYNVHKALQGVAVTRKILTVTGAVAAPCVMEVPLGASFKECIAHAGGPNCNDYRVVSGGPLMGNYFSKEESEYEVVTKTTSGILLLPLNAGKKELTIEQMKNRARASCIQCTYCTELCPRYLLGHPIEPHKIMRKLAYAKDFD